MTYVVAGRSSRKPEEEGTLDTALEMGAMILSLCKGCFDVDLEVRSAGANVSIMKGFCLSEWMSSYKPQREGNGERTEIWCQF